MRATAVLLLLIGAVLLWPPGTTGAAAGLGCGRVRRFRGSVATGVIGVAAVTGVVIGLLPGLACALLGLTIAGLIRRRRENGRAQELHVEFAGAVRSLAAELRAGAGPERAVGTVAEGISRPAADLLRAAMTGPGRVPATAIRAPDPGGTTGGPVAGTQVTPPAVREAVRGLGAVAAVSMRHGLPLAALVDALATRLQDEVRETVQRQASLAGARMSGMLLAGLPALGLVLGSAMGADPAAVLLHTGPGQVLLLAGVALVCLGLCWTERISR